MMYLISLVFLVFISITSPSHVLAQAPNEQSWAYQCINDFHQCSTNQKEVNQSCLPIDDDVHESNEWWHRIQMDLTKLTIPAQEMIILQCGKVDEDLDGDNQPDPVCTTGNSTLDKELFCGDPNATGESCDRVKILQEKKGYKINTGDYGIYHLINNKYEQVTQYKIPVDALGKITIPKVEWQSGTTEGEKMESFYYAAYINPPVTPTPTVAISTTPGVTISPGLGGHQQNIMTFPELEQQVLEEGECHSIAWDPYGTAFDAKTLEPVANVSVLLSMKNEAGVFDAGYATAQNLFISNPFLAGESGFYSFLVENGAYKLSPIKEGYTFPNLAMQSELNKNALTIYSDLYFSDSPPIVQNNKWEHRDIPMMPTNGVGMYYDLKSYSESEVRTPDSKIKYSGRVSHPYAEVVIETCKEVDGTEVCTSPKVYNHYNGGANKQGIFSITLDQKSLKQGEYYSRVIRKVDLTSIQLADASLLENFYTTIRKFILPKIIYAEEKQLKKAYIHPILSYVEGYAYDSNGNIMPNAKVNITSSISDQPVLQIMTNDKGYYKVTSEYLPKRSYSIEYSNNSSLNVPTTITTSQFLAQNSEFITAERINPYLITTKTSDPRRNTTPSFVPATKVSAITVPTKPAPNISVTAPTAQPKQTNSNTFLIGAILLLLVATAGTLIGVYLYKKKNQDQQE